MKIEIITGIGKTTKLIKKAHNTDKLIVCNSMRESDRIFEQSIEMKLKIHKPITYENMILSRRLYCKSILLDNMDLFLEYVTDGKIEAFTEGREKSFFHKRDIDEDILFKLKEEKLDIEQVINSMKP